MVDKLFHRHLLEDGVPPWLASLYYLAVKFSGAKDVKEANAEKFNLQKDISATYFD